MRTRSWRRWLPALACTAAIATAIAPTASAQTTAAASVNDAQRPAAGPSLPDRLSDADFWALVSDVSEPGGYFQIVDNYTSNERDTGQLFTALRDRGVRGGVYLGVGPEQNFTYVAAIRPAMAFIVDIRRQAVMQHLMYKAMFELTTNRPDFISLLFSMPRPAGLDETTHIRDIWAAYDPVATNNAAVPINIARVVDHLTKTHGFTFTAEELGQLESVMRAFARFGPDISTRGGPGNSSSFSDLTSWSLDANGQPQSFLTTEDHFRYVKAMHEKNLIVPVSGDFGGSTALHAVGAYLRKHSATVSAFYVSNVEQYLFPDNKDKAFYDNVAALPLDEASVFIRPFLRRRTGPVGPSLCPIGGFLRLVRVGLVQSYNDALQCLQ